MKTAVGDASLDGPMRDAKPNQLPHSHDVVLLAGELPDQVVDPAHPLGLPGGRRTFDPYWFGTSATPGMHASVAEKCARMGSEACRKRAAEDYFRKPS